MTLATQTAALNLGGLDLMSGAVDPTYGFRIRALSDNYTLGDPAAVIALIQSQLQDGDLERIDRYGNRSASIPLMIDAPNSGVPGDAIAHGQQAIDAVCAKASPLTGWTTLSWTSPLNGALTSVLDVVSATVTRTFDDVAESVAGYRLVTVTIHARPFVHPVNPVTISAQAVVGSTTTTVDDGTSLTNWSLLTAQPPNATNLVTNPSFETNTTGWAAGAGTSAIAQAPGSSAQGSYSLQVTPSATTSGLTGPVMAVSAGTTYTVGFSASGSTLSNAGLIVRFYSDSGGTTQTGSDANVAAGNGSISGTFLVPGGAVSARVLPTATLTGTGSPWYLDAVWAVAAANWRGAYFDGASTGTSAITYSWTGTANASTSTATVTTRTLAVVSGTVKGTVYSSGVASVRRTGAVSMTSLPWMRITGVATFNNTGGANNLVVTVADGGVSVPVVLSSVNPSTGDFSILLKRPGGFATSVDVIATYTGTTSINDVTTVAVDSIVITDTPISAGGIQTQALSVSGSERTDMSLLLRGQDAAGVNPVALGNEVLVYTASSGSDGRATFGSLRALANVTGTADATAVSGSYDTLSTTSTPNLYAFNASKLFPGNYMLYARIKAPTVVAGDLISFRAAANSYGGSFIDPPTGWKTAPFTAVASGAVWPQLNTNTWTMIPLGMLRLPPASMQDPSGTIGVYLAKGSTAVTLDEVFLCNADYGQASLVLAPSGLSSIRLDAASLTSPQALCWVGTAPGTNVNNLGGTFDSNTDSWAGSSGTTVARVTSPVHDGAGALQITWATASAGAASASGLTVSNLLATSPVTVTAWVQSASGQPTVQLRVDDGSGGSVVTSAASVANGTWQQLSVSYTPPASGKCRPQIINATAATSGNIAYVDTVQILSSTDYLIANPAAWFGEQHQALPGLLQIATVTPGCTTTRVSGTYYPKYHDDVASLT